MSYVTKENTEDIYPLAPIQKGMLFHAVSAEDGAVYFEQLGFTVDGPLERVALERAWNHLVKVTPIFRTVFRWDRASGPLQIVLKELPTEFALHDLTHLEPQAQRRAIADFHARDRERPFDLEEGPLQRLSLLRLAEDRHHLVWSRHHIIADGWCIAHVLGDLFAFYLAAAGGGELPRPQRRPYRDYIVWLKRQDQQRAQSFWRARLAGFETPTALPAGEAIAGLAYSERAPQEKHPGPDKPGGVAEHLLALSPAETRGLERLARERRCTLGTVVQALWALLLACYGNSDDVVFGVTSSGRPADLPGAEDMIGVFINTLPLRVQLGPELTFADLLEEVQRQSQAIREFEYSFLPDIRACSDLPHDRNLFDSIVVMENYPFTPGRAVPGADFTVSDVHTWEVSSFDLTLVAVPGACLELRVQYARRRFDARTIERLGGHLQRLISQVLLDSSIRLRDLDVLTPCERHRLLAGFNDTRRDYPRERTIPELFEEQVRSVPHKTALVFGQAIMSYGELNARAECIAKALRARGVGRGDFVGVMVERSFDMLASVLGVLKTGGAYVPLDVPLEPDYPPARIAYMLEETRPPVVIVHEALKDRLPEGAGGVLCLDELRGEDLMEGKGAEGQQGTADDPAYVIYTSGSTGRPKGVVVPHRGVVRLVKNTNYAAITPEDRFVQIATFAFDAATLEFWGPLLNGGTLVLASRDEVLSPEALADLLREKHVSIAFMTVVLFNQLVDQRPDGLAAFRRLLVGGETVSVSHMRRALGVVGPGVLANGYGPTENTTFSTWYPVDTIDAEATSLPIGYPLANSTVYILDRWHRPVPVGVTGEIWVGGDGLATGYLNDPEKTARAFVPLPVAPGEVLYRTGDLGRWRPDGAVEYLGRIDQQIKLRGFRIELGEIEAWLRESGGIRDCVCDVRRLPSGSRVLVAYYVGGDGMEMDDLRAGLRDRLPEYMVPGIFIRLEAIPLTPNGKVDRASLPDPGGSLPQRMTEYTPPAGQMESLIAAVWEEVLSVGRVGRHDNFFDLGGDSIICIQVAGRLKKQGVMMKPRDIFEHQTVARIARVAVKGDGVRRLPVQAAGPAPLTPIQCWFFDLQPTDAHHFNQALVLRVRQCIDAPALIRALTAVAAHHDALRLCFEDGHQSCPAQAAEPLFRERTIASGPELERIANELQAGFDLAYGPVFACALLHSQTQTVDYLVLAAHHLVIDGVSWRILLEDLFSAYTCVLEGGQVRLPEETTTYLEWAQALQDYARLPDLGREAAWWRDFLDVNPPKLTCDFDRGPNNAASLRVVRTALSQETTGCLLYEAHAALHTEVNDLLVTGLMRALARWGGQGLVVFDLEAHGREEVLDGADLSRTVGWFTAIFPVALEAGRHADIADQVRYVKETLRSIPDKGFNYGVLRYLQPEPAVPRSPSQVLFNYLGQLDAVGPSSEIELVDDLEIQASHADNPRSHLIDISCKVLGARLVMEVGYSANHFGPATMEGLARILQKEIARVVETCVLTSRTSTIRFSEFIYSE